MGHFLSDKQFDWARTLIDKDGSGAISYNEFAAWWQNPSRFDHLQVSDEQLDHLHKIVVLFRSYDRKNKGQLDKRNFEALLHDLIKQGIMEDNQASQFEEIDR